MLQDSREQLIMDAAEAMLARFGEKRMTMDDVAEVIGLSRPAIYQYFHSKNELVLATLNRLHERSLKRVQEATRARSAKYAGVAEALKERETFLFDLAGKSADKSWFLRSSIPQVTKALAQIEMRFSRLIQDRLIDLGFELPRARLNTRLLLLYAQEVRMTAGTERELHEKLDFCLASLIDQKASAGLPQRLDIAAAPNPSRKVM